MSQLVMRLKTKTESDQHQQIFVPVHTTHLLHPVCSFQCSIFNQHRDGGSQAKATDFKTQVSAQVQQVSWSSCGNVNAWPNLTQVQGLKLSLRNTTDPLQNGSLEISVLHLGMRDKQTDCILWFGPAPCCCHTLDELHKLFGAILWSCLHQRGHSWSIS